MIYSIGILIIHSKILFYETGKVRGEEFNSGYSYPII